MARALTGALVRTLLNKIIPDAAGTLTIIAATNASPQVVNVTAHGLSVGDVLFISGTTTDVTLNGLKKVRAVTDADHFTLNDFFTGAVLNAGGASGGSPIAQRIEWGGTPDDLADLQATMDRTKKSAGRVADSKRPSATLETTIAVALGQ